MLGPLELELTQRNADQQLQAFFTFMVGVYKNHVLYKVGGDSVVGIATCYELDGPGIESRWG